MTREWKRPPASPTGASHGWLAGTTRSQHTPGGAPELRSDEPAMTFQAAVDKCADTHSIVALTSTPPPGRFQSWDNWLRATDRKWGRYQTGDPCDWIDFTWDWTAEQRQRFTEYQRQRWLRGLP